MREKGTGTIEDVPGGKRPRLPGRGARRLGVYPTQEEAEAVLAAALAELAKDPAEGGLTLKSWGASVYDRRELARQRSAKDSRKVFNVHVAETWLGKLPLVTITRADVITWTKELATRRTKPGRGFGEAAKASRADRLISKSTAQNALNQLRVVLGEAAEEEIIPENPADGVKLPSSIRKRARTHETWTYLPPDEQLVVLTSPKVPDREKVAIAFAMGTGARQNEMWNIRRRDLDTTAWTVTLRETKNGKPRTIPLLPIAREAIELWLPTLDAEHEANVARAAKRGLVCKRPEWLWPSIRGCKRSGDPKHWQAWMEKLGLVAEKRRDGKHVRWHDLRHTCATSLVQGWWGRAWSLEEVQVQLDHESIITTERYAHLDGGIARRAAEATVRLTTDVTTAARRDAENRRNFGAPPARIELAANGLGSEGTAEEPRVLAVLRGASVVPSLEDIALDVLNLAAVGDPRTIARAIELAERVRDEAAELTLERVGGAS